VIAVEILAHDNVKYLYVLDKFIHSLYRLDPTNLGEYLASLMYVLQMIFTTSRFFNTKGMVTAVFVKVIIYLYLYYLI
jgi:dynein heavy chain